MHLLVHSRKHFASCGEVGVEVLSWHHCTTLHYTRLVVAFGGTCSTLLVWYKSNLVLFEVLSLLLLLPRLHAKQMKSTYPRTVVVHAKDTALHLRAMVCPIWFECSTMVAVSKAKWVQVDLLLLLELPCRLHLFEIANKKS